MYLNSEYFEKYVTETGIKPQTAKRYKTSLARYSAFHGMKFDELIEEAMQEEDDKIPLRKRKIKSRILSFRTFLLNETDLKSSTVKKYMANILALYRYNDIELPDITPIKNQDDVIEVTYYDLPTRNHISKAVEFAGILVASLILFMASNGAARAECASLTVGEFLEACKGYYNKETIPEINEELFYTKEDIVPTFNIYRKKTSKRYYTFCTPQATHAILKWLMLRLDTCEMNKNNPDPDVEKEITWDSSLWNLNTRQISYHFERLNNFLKFGHGKDGYDFFRPHMLRKFNASNLGLDKESIGLIQGRSKNNLHATYIKTNPEKLKQRYMAVMENVTIGEYAKKEVIHEDITLNINLNFYGQEYGVQL